jgi:hypothetical protein
MYAVPYSDFYWLVPHLRASLVFDYRVRYSQSSDFIFHPNSHTEKIWLVLETHVHHVTGITVLLAATGMDVGSARDLAWDPRRHLPPHSMYAYTHPDH